MTLARDTNIPVSLLRVCFTFIPPIALRWKVRPRWHFGSGMAWRRFNTQFAGRLAGTIDKNGT